MEIKHETQEMIFIDKMKMVVPISNKKECQISHPPKLWMEGDLRNPNETMLTFYDLMVDTFYILAFIDTYC